MRHSSTTHQRGMIRGLLRDLDLPTDYVTKLNFAAFDAAKVRRPTEGCRVDSALEQVTQDEASRLITALKQIKGA